MKVAWYVRFCSIVGFCALSSVTSAQTNEQKAVLVTGWNAVFLRVDPSSPNADQLFANHAIEAVWMMQPKVPIAAPAVGCQGPDDPFCNTTSRSRWRVWVPVGHPDRPVSNLRKIRGGRVYYIRTGQATTLSITGTPAEGITQWEKGYNLVGFYVDPNAPPTFQDYLNPSGRHNTISILGKNADGSLATLNGAGAPSPDLGYWVRADGSAMYDGPVGIDTISLAGIHFGPSKSQHSLRLSNLSSADRTIGLDYLAAESATSGTEPENAGDVPLRWFEILGGVVEGDGHGNLVNDVFSWHDFSNQSYPTTSVGAFAAKGLSGSSRNVKLSVNRLATPIPATIDTTDDGVSSSYQGILRITDGAGYLRDLSVTMEVGPGSPSNTASSASSSGSGLWVGAVTVNKVAWSTAGSDVWTNSQNPGATPTFIGQADADSTTLRATKSSFVFPVIIHVDSSGTTKLLTEVTMLFDPVTPGSQTGDFVLATPSCTDCDQYEAGSILNGKPFSYRISSTGYAFDGNLGMTGSFGVASGALDCEISLAPDDRLNPFRHKYHPDHDCVDSNGNPKPGECYALTRDMSFTFDASQPTGDANSAWGTTYWTGSYTERLVVTADTAPIAGCSCTSSSCVGGPHAGASCTDDIDCACNNQYVTRAGGNFELTRISTVSTLNGQ